MKRNMDTVRKILLAIEERYVDTVLYSWELSIDGLSLPEIAYHCKILHDGGMISDYKAQFAEDSILDFGVGALTWTGHDFLDKIRDDSFWGDVKRELNETDLPWTIDLITRFANALISRKVEGWEAQSKRRQV